MAVFRVEKNQNYTTMSNYHLRDKELSLKAKGLLSFCLSLPESWDYSIMGLVAVCKENRDCIMSTLKELEQRGYLVRTRQRKPDGTLGVNEYCIFETPQPKSDNPTLEEPIAEQPTVLNEIAVMPPESYDPSKYKRTVFRMFDTEEPVTVELLCDVSTMKYLIDNFGKDIKTEVIDDNTFKAFIEVCASSTFYRWVFGFAGKIQIVGPINSVEGYRNMLTSALDNYR